jgi:hypothetical protein
MPIYCKKQKIPELVNEMNIIGEWNTGFAYTSLLLFCIKYKPLHSPS